MQCEVNIRHFSYWFFMDCISFTLKWEWLFFKRHPPTNSVYLETKLAWLSWVCKLYNIKTIFVKWNPWKLLQWYFFLGYTTYEKYIFHSLLQCWNPTLTSPLAFSEGRSPFWVPPLSESNLKGNPPLSESHLNWCM